MQFLPTVRTEDIVVKEAGKELVLYDLQFKRAYCLNETFALIYMHCNGKTTFDDIKLKYRNLSDEVIWSAIDRLGDRRLFNEKAYAAQAAR